MIRHALAPLLLVAALAAACQAPTLPAYPLGAWARGEIVVRWADPARAEAVHAALGGRALEGESLQRVAVPDGQEPAYAERYRQAGGVAFAEPNFLKRTQHVPGSLRPLRRVQLTPNDPLFVDAAGKPAPSKLANLSALWGLRAIKAEAAWDVTAGDPAVTVAVIDTGVDLTHPDLQPNLDTANALNMVERGSAVDDDFGHGTHVAGIIAAVGNNAQGTVGVAWRARLLPIRVLGVDGTGSTFNTAAALDYAVKKGARVINMSLGSPDRSEVEAQAIERALAAGAVVVAAAGNEATTGNYLEYPACYPGVLSVAAVDYGKERAPFSNYNSKVSLAAPGVDVLSTIPIRLGGATGYGYLSGTSMAAPFVAGAAALVASQHPDWGADRIGARLKQTAEELAAKSDPVAGYDVFFGYGLLDAARAVAP